MSEEIVITFPNSYTFVTPPLLASPSPFSLVSLRSPSSVIGCPVATAGGKVANSQYKINKLPTFPQPPVTGYTNMTTENKIIQNLQKQLRLSWSDNNFIGRNISEVKYYI